MPTITVNITDVKRKGNNIQLTAQQGNKVIYRTLDRSSVDSWDDFANWLINQEPDFELLPEKNKTLEITFHTETVDTELGEVTVKVLDGVVVT